MCGTVHKKLRDLRNRLQSYAIYFNVEKYRDLETRIRGHSRSE